MTRHGILAGSVDRGNLVDWLGEVLAEADGLPLGRMVQMGVSPGGLVVDARFDDADLATAYCDRFRNIRPAAHAAAENRIHVLTGKSLELPEWIDPSFEAGTFHALLGNAGFRAAYPYQNGLWQIFDRRSRVGLQWCPTPERLPPWDASAPLRQHLHWLLQESGMRLAHAATLGLEDRGVVLFGRGGAGKSGTTIAGLAAGLSTVGDDYVALANDPRPLARPLLRTIKQDREGLARIPGLPERTRDLALNWRGKVEFDPAAFFDGPMIEAMPLKAAILPRIAHAERPTLIPARPQSVMLSLMTSNLHQFAGEEDDGMRFFAQFLKDLPCFHLDLSPDAVRNGNLLREFVERLPR